MDDLEFVFEKIIREMNLTKAQKLALAPPTGTSRRGLDKSKLAESTVLEELPQTQEYPMDDDWTDQRKMMDASLEEDEDDGVTDTLEEEFNAHAEELFLDKLDRWFAEFGPKLYDLGLSKHLSKMEKKKLKEESSETSRRSAKKRKS